MSPKFKTDDSENDDRSNLSNVQEQNYFIAFQLRSLPSIEDTYRFIMPLIVCRDSLIGRRLYCIYI